MDNQNGTTDIPAVTPAAEHLSTLTTLAEVRDKWVKNNSVAVPVFPVVGGLFGLGTTLGKHSSPAMKKKAPVKCARKSVT